MRKSKILISHNSKENLSKSIQKYFYSDKTFTIKETEKKNIFDVYKAGEEFRDYFVKKNKGRWQFRSWEE